MTLNVNPPFTDEEVEVAEIMSQLKTLCPERDTNRQRRIQIEAIQQQEKNNSIFSPPLSSPVNKLKPSSSSSWIAKRKRKYDVQIDSGLPSSSCAVQTLRISSPSTPSLCRIEDDEIPFEVPEKIRKELEAWATRLDEYIRTLNIEDTDEQKLQRREKMFNMAKRMLADRARMTDQELSCENNHGEQVGELEENNVEDENEQQIPIIVGAMQEENMVIDHTVGEAIPIAPMN